MSESVQIDDKALKAKLMFAVNVTPLKFRAALQAIGENVKLDSMENTPVRWGVLRGSHKVRSIGNDAVSVEVGSSAAPYALFVHENLEADHSVEGGFGGGEAKFLENAANRARATLPKDLERVLEGIGA